MLSLRDMKHDFLPPTTLRKAKIVYNFGLSGCNSFNYSFYLFLS